MEKDLYAIAKHRKHRSLSQARAAAGHNRRTLLEDKRRENIDPNRSHMNILLLGSGDPYADLKKKLEGVQRRKNSVVTVEVLLTASHEWFKTEQSVEDIQREALEFIKEKYGDNAYYAELHMDEKTPHIHVHVVPIELGTDARRKDKNEVVKKLNAKKMTSMESLRQTITDWAERMKPYGLIRGIQTNDAEAIALREQRRAIAREHQLALASKEEIQKKAKQKVKAFKAPKVETTFADRLDPASLEQKVREGTEEHWRKLAYGFVKKTFEVEDKLAKMEEEFGAMKQLLNALTSLTESSWPMVEKLFAAIVGKYPDEPFPTLNDTVKVREAMKDPTIAAKIRQADKKRHEAVEAANEAAEAAAANRLLLLNESGGSPSGASRPEAGRGESPPTTLLTKAQAKTGRKRRRRAPRSDDKQVQATTTPKPTAQASKPAPTPLQTIPPLTPPQTPPKPPKPRP